MFIHEVAIFLNKKLDKITEHSNTKHKSELVALLVVNLSYILGEQDPSSGLDSADSG